MKSPTSIYKNLSIALRGLKKILNGVPSTSCDNDIHHLKVQSYILMSHAAFEHYIEDISSFILNESVNNFNIKKNMNRCIVSLIVFETIAQADNNLQRTKIKANVVTKLQDFVNTAKKNHDVVINNNNGIKLKDQKALLLPIGVDPEEVDIITANALDAYGAKRGVLAHKHKMQTAETKSSVLTSTGNLLKGLMIYDEEICDVMNKKFS